MKRTQLGSGDEHAPSSLDWAHALQHCRDQSSVLDEDQSAIEPPIPSLDGEFADSYDDMSLDLFEHTGAKESKRYDAYLERHLFGVGVEKGRGDAGSTFGPPTSTAYPLSDTQTNRLHRVHLARERAIAAGTIRDVPASGGNLVQRISYTLHINHVLMSKVVRNHVDAMQHASLQDEIESYYNSILCEYFKIFADAGMTEEGEEGWNVWVSAQGPQLHPPERRGRGGRSFSMPVVHIAFNPKGHGGALDLNGGFTHGQQLHVRMRACVHA
jgi:hypothetical protein